MENRSKKRGADELEQRQDEDLTVADELVRDMVKRACQARRENNAVQFSEIPSLLSEGASTGTRRRCEICVGRRETLGDCERCKWGMSEMELARMVSVAMADHMIVCFSRLLLQSFPKKTPFVTVEDELDMRDPSGRVGGSSHVLSVPLGLYLHVVPLLKTALVWCFGAGWEGRRMRLTRCS
ncbi:hypothetical protein BJ742DRAFT_743878 [Cladochytrium replicatum]|nr:hypothetical protein BJ742DRAFT_743878 [Cladochytrium replicatum]